MHEVRRRSHVSGAIERRRPPRSAFSPNLLSSYRIRLESGGGFQYLYPARLAATGGTRRRAAAGLPFSSPFYLFHNHGVAAMVDIRLDRNVWFRAALAGAVIALCKGSWAEGQGPGPGLGPGLSSGLPALPGGPEPGLPPSVPTPGLTGMTGKEQVVDVRVEGVDEKDLHRAVKYIRTHAGRPFDRLTVENDVKRLLNSKRFAGALPSYQRVGENGLIVIFRVVERPTIRYVKYVGNTIAKRHLDKKTKLKPGDPLDAYAVDEGRRPCKNITRKRALTRSACRSSKARSRKTGAWFT